MTEKRKRKMTAELLKRCIDDTMTQGANGNIDYWYPLSYAQGYVNEFVFDQSRCWSDAAIIQTVNNCSAYFLSNYENFAKGISKADRKLINDYLDAKISADWESDEQKSLDIFDYVMRHDKLLGSFAFFLENEACNGKAANTFQDRNRMLNCIESYVIAYNFFRYGRMIDA